MFCWWWSGTSVLLLWYLIVANVEVQLRVPCADYSALTLSAIHLDFPKPQGMGDIVSLLLFYLSTLLKPAMLGRAPLFRRCAIGAQT